MGHSPAVFNDVGLQSFLWPVGQNPLRWHSLPDLCICRAGSLEFLCSRADTVLKQLGHQCKPAKEGLLPTVGYSSGNRLVGSCGLRPRLCCASGNDVLLPNHPDSEYSVAALVTA